MKILLTGGTGFLGSHLITKLLELDHSILVVDNLSLGKKEFLPSSKDKLQFEECDITKKQRLEAVLETFKPEVIIHLAAIHYIPYCNEYPFKTLKTNVVGTRNLLEICFEAPPEIFFFSSTAAVYPIRDIANREDSETSPTDIYGISKLIGEDLVHLYHLKTGVRAIIGRLFNMYGPNPTNPHLIPEIIKQIQSNQRTLKLGNLEAKRDFIYVKDVADAIINLINSNVEFGIFNIGTGLEYSGNEIIHFIQEILSEKIEIIQDKNKLRKSDRMHLLANIDKIKNYTNWSPQWNLKDGLKELLEQ